MSNDPIKMAIEAINSALGVNASGFHLTGENVEGLRRSVAALRQHQQDGGWRDSRVPTLEALISLRKSGKHQCKITEQLEAEILALAADIRKSPAPKKENDDGHSLR